MTFKKLHVKEILIFTTLVTAVTTFTTYAIRSCPCENHAHAYRHFDEYSNTTQFLDQSNSSIAVFCEQTKALFTFWKYFASNTEKQSQIVLE